MATYDEDPIYNPTPLRRKPVQPPADVPRGGMGVPTGYDPAAGMSERDLAPEVYAEPDSLTRSMRYGPGDERDLSVPVPPRTFDGGTWGAPVTAGGRTTWRSTTGGEASIAGAPPRVEDISAPRTPFADAPGQSLADTLASGRRAQAQQDALGLTTADMDYIRSYGRRAFDERNARFSAPATRADYLARQAGNLSVSVAERRAAQDELARLDRLAADERRREEWALAQAAQTDRARIAASAPVSFGAGAGVVPDGNGGWTELRPPAPEAKPTPPPAPVGFGNGAGAIPEVDENGVTTWRESRPQAPLYSTTPRGEVYNNQTGDITHEVLTAGQDRNGNKRYVVKGRLVDADGNVLFDGQPTQTEQALARKYAERQAAIRANAGMLDPATLQAIDAEIAALEAKLEAEHAAPAPAATEQAAPAPAEAQPAPEPAPAPAPAAAAEKKPDDPWAMYGGLYK